MYNSTSKERDFMVSIILPTYRQKELMKKAVNSVLSQSYRNIELIIVDDNYDSFLKSENEEFFNNLKDKRVVYVQNERNLGSARSRNKGINIAKGDYITFLDDDDLYSYEKVERQLKFMLDNQLDVSVCNMILTNERGKIIDARRRKYFSNNEPLIVKHLKYHITGTDTMMFRTSFLKTIGGFVEKDLGDEFLLMLKAIEFNGKIGHIDFDGAIATVHSNSGLSSFGKKIITEKDMMRVKSNYFSQLSKKDIRFIKMRHYAVLAIAYKKGKKSFGCIVNLIKAFFTSPSGFVKLYSGDCR